MFHGDLFNWGIGVPQESILGPLLSVLSWNLHIHCDTMASKIRFRLDSIYRYGLLPPSVYCVFYIFSFCDATL